MKDLLEQIPFLAIKLHPTKLTEEQKRLGWLGDGPAQAEEIELAERRLGVKLPDDYKAFLFLTNGFFYPLRLN